MIKTDLNLGFLIQFFKHMNTHSVDLSLQKYKVQDFLWEKNWHENIGVD